VRIRADGEDEQEAIAALTKLIEETRRIVERKAYEALIQPIYTALAARPA